MVVAAIGDHEMELSEDGRSIGVLTIHHKKPLVSVWQAMIDASLD
jgi:hypothetical protein|tara:strand:+ start:2258 stop:2392 length:135 start_codon:yes stop_codon:yes gene_type:complete